MERYEHRWKDRGIWLHRDGEVMLDNEPVWYDDGNEETVFQATDQRTTTQVEATNEKAFGGKEQHGTDAGEEESGTLSIRDIEGNLVWQAPKASLGKENTVDEIVVALLKGAERCNLPWRNHHLQIFHEGIPLDGGETIAPWIRKQGHTEWTFTTTEVVAASSSGMQGTGRSRQRTETRYITITATSGETGEVVP